MKLTTPNYFYFKQSPYEIGSRISYQKHKLHAKLPLFDESKTEYENMKANGYKRVFDASNLKVIKKYE